jgi:predicted Zn-dependent protease
MLSARYAETIVGLAILVAVISSGCRTTPVTGRKQLLLLPEDQEISMGLSAYEDATSGQPLSQNPQYQEMVNRVGQRIAAVADRPDYQWEFRVVASPEQNAFCLPGGKVVVYEGILPVCGNEAGLAVVMSHEIAHVLARHGGERMSHGMAVNGLRRAVDYVTKDREEREREMILKAYGMGSKYGVVLPYSRKHELEADSIGLVLMARAGYDPAEAPRFWQRFAALKQGNQPIEFLSTHPTDEKRSAELAARIPEAQELYAQAPAHFGLGEALPGMPAPAANLVSAPEETGSGSFLPAGLTNVIQEAFSVFRPNTEQAGEPQPETILR